MKEHPDLTDSTVVFLQRAPSLQPFQFPGLLFVLVAHLSKQSQQLA
jgi:hypothetical protein